MANNLENFRQDAPMARLDSPRSLEACEAVGVLPEELLLNFDPKQFAGLRPELAERKKQVYEDRRYQLLQECRAMRKKLIEEESHAERNGMMELHQERIAGRIAMQQAAVENMERRTEDQIRAMIANELLKKKTADKARRRDRFEHEKKLAEEERRKERQHEWQIKQTQLHQARVRREEEEKRRQRALAEKEYRKARAQAQERERQRQERLAEIAHKTKESDERRRQRQEALAKQHEEQEAETRRKLQRMRKMEQQRQEMMKAQREEMRRQMQALHKRHQDRVLQAREMNERIMQEKQEAARQRALEADRRRAELERQAALDAQTRAKDAEAHAARIAEAQRLADKRLQAKINRTLAKQRHAQRVLEQREVEREQLEEENAKWLEQKRARLAAIRQHEKDLLQERVDSINEKRRQVEERNRRFREEREAALEAKKLEDDLLREERERHVQRMARKKEYERKKLMQQIERDNRRVETVRRQYDQLKKERLRLRDMTDDRRKKINMIFAKIESSQTVLNIDEQDLQEKSIDQLLQQLQEDTGIPAAEGLLISPRSTGTRSSSHTPRSQSRAHQGTLKPLRSPPSARRSNRSISNSPAGRRARRKPGSVKSSSKSSRGGQLTSSSPSSSSSYSNVAGRTDSGLKPSRRSRSRSRKPGVLNHSPYATSSPRRRRPGNDYAAEPGKSPASASLHGGTGPRSRFLNKLLKERD